ncbi:hypothetical protein Tco_0611402 [Tanacetum coccineum]
MSLGNILPPWHQFLDQKIRGAHFSLGIVAGERFAIELTPSTFPQRHFAGDMFPQRHVAGERVGMLLGKASNVVVKCTTKLRWGLKSLRMDVGFPSRNENRLEQGSAHKLVIMGVSLDLRGIPDFVEEDTAESVGLRVADFHTGNYGGDDFTSLETI